MVREDQSPHSRQFDRPCIGIEDAANDNAIRKHVVSKNFSSISVPTHPLVRCPDKKAAIPEGGNYG
jgi:hypothetical protein